MPLIASCGSFAGPMGGSVILPATYTFTYERAAATPSDPLGVDEGGTFSIRLDTTGVANGTVIPYTTSGSSNGSDFSTGSLSGNFVIATDGSVNGYMYPYGSGRITFNVSEDTATEGTEVLIVNAASRSITITIYDTSRGSPYWTTTSSNIYRGSAVDSTGNFITAGSSGSYADGVIVKRDANGTFIWARNFAANTFINMAGAARERTISSTANTTNLYFVGTAEALSSGARTYTEVTFIGKADTNGSLLWQRRLTKSTSRGINWGSTLAADHTGVTVCMLDGVVKYNTTGTLSYQKTMSGSSMYFYSVTSREGYSYTNGVEFPGATGYTHILKTDTSGNTTWKRRLDVGTGFYFVGAGMEVDGSQNVYIAGRTSMVSGSSVFIKLDSSGGTVWARRIPSVVIQSIYWSEYDGYLYIAGDVSGGTYIAKVDTSGNFIWERFLSGSGTYAKISCDSSGFLYVSTVAGKTMKFATDGSGVGNPSSYTSLTSTIVDIASSVTNITSASTVSNLTWTNSTTTHTFNSTTSDQTLTNY